MRRVAGGLLLAILTCLATTGCIRSRVVLTSEPSGAEVIWRGEPYGATPIEIPFIWYWHYHYTIEKPGYETIEVTEKLKAPPWFIFPADLVMEVLPVPIPDTRRRHYVMDPLPSNGGLGEGQELLPGPGEDRNGGGAPIFVPETSE